MKDKILEAFKKLGFKLEYIEGAGYSFFYEGTGYLWSYNEEDENFFNISIPSVYEFEDDKIAQNCALMFKVNCTMKYVKAYYVGRALWLSYEREVFGDEDFTKLIPPMVLHLDASLKYTRDAISDIENMVDEEDEAGDDVSDEDEENDGDCFSEVTDEDENNEK